MKSLLKQLKNRRLQLGLKQHDMWLCVGMSRQQYQHLESKGNPRLATLELIAKGMKSKVMLIPQGKLTAVKALLESETPDIPPAKVSPAPEEKCLSDDPWEGLLVMDDE